MPRAFTAGIALSLCLTAGVKAQVPLDCLSPAVMVVPSVACSHHHVTAPAYHTIWVVAAGAKGNVWVEGDTHISCSEAIRNAPSGKTRVACCTIPTNLNWYCVCKVGCNPNDCPPDSCNPDTCPVDTFTVYRTTYSSPMYHTSLNCGERPRLFPLFRRCR